MRADTVRGGESAVVRIRYGIAEAVAPRIDRVTLLIGRHETQGSGRQKSVMIVWAIASADGALQPVRCAGRRTRQAAIGDREPGQCFARILEYPARFARLP